MYAMRLLIDNQLPFQLAVFLRWRGHDCVHVCDEGLAQATDLAVWQHAAQDNRIVVSRDEDFVSLANRPDDLGRLIWVRLGNCRNTRLLETFDRLHDQLVAAVEDGQRIIEVR